MSDGVESVENVVREGLSTPGVDSLLCLQASDRAVVEPTRGDCGHQRGRVPGRRVDGAFEGFDELRW